jgi:acyl carrier protein
MQFSVSPADPRFGQNTNLFEDGYVDSIGLAELIGFLEDEFGVDISDELLVSDQFKTIVGISETVCRLSAA